MLLWFEGIVVSDECLGILGKDVMGKDVIGSIEGIVWFVIREGLEATTGGEEIGKVSSQKLPSLEFSLWR